ncbi:hypothetical protein SJDPG11_02080 [Porphyromonas gingivalis SJD11]|nr:hypothetical protein SJDPG11_02080 [Porphyromonas gingivalis SJD11]
MFSEKFFTASFGPDDEQPAIRAAANNAAPIFHLFILEFLLFKYQLLSKDSKYPYLLIRAGDNNRPKKGRKERQGR